MAQQQQFQEMSIPVQMQASQLHPRTRQIKSTCCYCGVGCGVIIKTENDKIVDVQGDPKHPANFGRLCTKGSTLHLTAKLDARALYPELRSQPQ